MCTLRNLCFYFFCFYFFCIFSKKKRKRGSILLHISAKPKLKTPALPASGVRADHPLLLFFSALFFHALVFFSFFLQKKQSAEKNTLRIFSKKKAQRSAHQKRGPVTPNPKGVTGCVRQSRCRGHPSGSSSHPTAKLNQEGWQSRIEPLFFFEF